MIVCLSNHELIRPHLITFKDIYRLLILFEGVLEVAQLECVVVIPAIFLDADQLCVREYKYLALVSLDSSEIKEDVNFLVCLEIPD